MDTSSWGAGSLARQAAVNAFPTPPNTNEGSILAGSQSIEYEYPQYGRVDAISISGVGQLVSGTAERTYQNQWEGAYTFAKEWGRHELRLGADYIRLVPGQPIWIASNSVPGGQELNPNAFQAATTGLNGTLGRNILTGPGLFQIDASLRRQFRLFGRSSLETSVSAFNLLNHASFANPVGYLESPLFGQPVSMQNLMMGSGNPTNGLAPIFQPGGPRTVEVYLKITF